MTDHSSMGAEPHDEIYLEVATTLVAFLLAGRYFEVRSRRRAGAALRSLLKHWSERGNALAGWRRDPYCYWGTWCWRDICCATR